MNQMGKRSRTPSRPEMYLPVDGFPTVNLRSSPLNSRERH
jgi:hypothetical protein